VNKATGEWQWPFAEANLALTGPIASILLAELESLDREMTAVVGERPALDAYLEKQRRDLQLVGDQIRNKEVELSGAIAASEMIAQMGNRNNAASRVVGRISLFLENLVPNNELVRLQAEERRLKAKVDDLEQKIGADDSGARLASTLNNISMHMSGYIADLGGEFGQFPARLDLHNLTVVIDRPSRPIYMNRTGGGENHLAYHLSALLALHRFATNHGQPMPRFLLIDQPTQVYFPSETVYAEAAGSIERTEKDADLEAVRRLFELLLRLPRRMRRVSRSSSPSMRTCEMTGFRMRSWKFPGPNRRPWFPMIGRTNRQRPNSLTPAWRCRRRPRSCPALEGKTRSSHSPHLFKPAQPYVHSSAEDQCPLLSSVLRFIRRPPDYRSRRSTGPPASDPFFRCAPMTKAQTGKP
jgi:hypothetical protein